MGELEGRRLAVESRAPVLLVEQLRRVLRTCPEGPDGAPKARPGLERDRRMVLHTESDGWLTGGLCLPPEEAARFEAALDAARDAEFRERQGLDADADLGDPGPRSGVTLVDGLMRLCGEGLDALDQTFVRTGVAGDRHHLVLHRDITTEGLGPAQLHLGSVLPDTVARYFGCDARVTTVTWVDGALRGIDPTDRTVNRALRRAIERRDQGCVHPLCRAKRWLHVHHIHQWEDGGPTVPANLCCLCPAHHRQLHQGEFRIEGSPEDGTLAFCDAQGARIEPPVLAPLARQMGPAYEPPCGERWDGTWFSWN